MLNSVNFGPRTIALRRRDLDLEREGEGREDVASPISGEEALKWRAGEKSQQHHLPTCRAYLCVPDLDRASKGKGAE